MASRCRSCLRFSSYALIPLIASLAYFYIQCIEEKKLMDELNKFNEKFDPDITDITDYTLKFCPLGAKVEMHLGLQYMLMQSFPCPLVRLIMFLSRSKSFAEMAKEDDNEPHNVTFFDARKNSPGDFHESGFTLVELEEEPVTKDWRSNSQNSKDPDINKFQKQMEPHIQKMYPGAKRILWTFNVVRGGDKFGDQPKAIDGPHLDYHQNRSARVEFHKQYPPFDIELMESKLLMGESNTADETLKVLLGVWVPIRPNATVCDHPLAIMDARTFDLEHQLPNELHINFGPFGDFNNFNAAIAFDPKQRWYYYPFQTTKEVLVFHQYSEDRFFANPHTSFINRNCPADSESRLSVEMRLALFF